MAALVWLVLGLLLVAAEVLSGDFTLLMLGGGALAAAGVSAFDPPLLVGGLVFGVTSVLLVFAVRPALRRRLHRGVDHSIMHSQALVGQPAVVTARVDGHGGRIKVHGDVWSARAVGDQVIEPGTAVTVVDISGATAMVTVRD